MNLEEQVTVYNAVISTSAYALDRVLRINGIVGIERVIPGPESLAKTVEHYNSKYFTHMLSNNRPVIWIKDAQW